MTERLQKLLSQWGIASRRHAESLIKSGRVHVNGQVAELGQKADPDSDRITLDGRQLSAQNRPQQHYLLLHKPVQVVSTCHDPQGRKTVLEYLPERLKTGTGIHPVGRLDYNSTGALLLTNDGALTQHLTHPRYHLPKTYRVVVRGRPSAKALQQWRQGVMLDGRQTLAAEVKVVSDGGGQDTELEIVLQEGRNRQIRRVADLLGYPVKALHRTAIGPIELKGLPTGHVRTLSATELGILNQGTEAASSPPRLQNCHFDRY